jgi:predicted secreted hydrolase
MAIIKKQISFMALKYRQIIIWIFIGLIFIGPMNNGYASETAEVFQKINGPCNFSFPRDHAAHPRFKTEWWYYTGNLSTPKKEEFGFQMTLFRVRLNSLPNESSPSKRGSPWRTSQAYIGHAAISHINQNRHLSDQTITRAALGMAGSETLPQNQTHIYIGNWSIKISPPKHHIKVHTDEFNIKLDLIPEKPWVAHGQGGYSQKGGHRESASCYYSFTRMKTHGTIEIDSTIYQVSGLSWMDREYFNASLEKNIVGWDWFSLQLSDQSEIMLYLLRQKDDTFHPVSQGTLVDKDGRTRSLSMNDISIKTLNNWKSDVDETLYPTKWQIIFTSLNLKLQVTTRISNQEMLTKETTGIRYYEGSVRITGDKDSKPVHGLGYVELTGYAQHFDTGQIW